MNGAQQSKVVHKSQLYGRLFNLCRATFGESFLQMAEHYFLHVEEVHDIMEGKRPIPDSMLSDIGVARVTRYVEIES